MITNTVDLSGVVMPFTSQPLQVQASGDKVTVYLINLTDINFSIDFGNGQTGHLPSWWARPFCVVSSGLRIVLTSAFMPNGYVEPNGNHIAVETWLPSEDTSKLADTPLPAAAAQQGSVVTFSQAEITGLFKADNGVQFNLPAVSAQGSSTGTVSIYEWLQGPNLKKVQADWTGYQTTAQTLVLPVPFTFGAQFHIGELQGGTVEFLLNGVAQKCSVLESISPSGGGGSQGPFTLINGWSFGQVRFGFDSLRFTLPNTAGGFLILDGK